MLVAFGVYFLCCDVVSAIGPPQFRCAQNLSKLGLLKRLYTDFEDVRLVKRAKLLQSIQVFIR